MDWKRQVVWELDTFWQVELQPLRMMLLAVDHLSKVARDGQSGVACSEMTASCLGHRSIGNPHGSKQILLTPGYPG